MDEILLLLLSRGAHKRPLRLTTSEIGSQCGMSQQNASRKLALLSEEGYIERGKEGMRLTKKAYGEAATLYAGLRKVFEGGKLDLEGTIVKGLGEGGFYMSLPGYRRQIREKLGFDPFPGTLNIRLEEGEAWKRRLLLEGEPVIISGFRDRNRTFGDLFAYRCSVAGKGGAVIVPLRTHHGPEILELVFGFNAKRALRKKDGDAVRVSV